MYAHIFSEKVLQKFGLSCGQISIERCRRPSFVSVILNKPLKNDVCISNIANNEERKADIIISDDFLTVELSLCRFVSALEVNTRSCVVSCECLWFIWLWILHNIVVRRVWRGQCTLWPAARGAISFSLQTTITSFSNNAIRKWGRKGDPVSSYQVLQKPHKKPIFFTRYDVSMHKCTIYGIFRLLGDLKDCVRESTFLWV